MSLTGMLGGLGGLGGVSTLGALGKLVLGGSAGEQGTQSAKLANKDGQVSNDPMLAAMLAAMVQSGAVSAGTVSSAGGEGASQAMSGATASSTGPGFSPTAALGNVTQSAQQFMQSLLSLLQGDGSGNPTATSAPDQVISPSALTVPSSSPVASNYGNPASGVQAGLQNLIQQVGSGVNSGASATIASPAGSGINTLTHSLERDYQNLVNLYGGNGSQASLGSFLTQLSSQLSASQPGFGYSARV